jgi:hypothetical protein
MVPLFVQVPVVQVVIFQARQARWIAVMLILNPNQVQIIILQRTLVAAGIGTVADPLKNTPHLAINALLVVLAELVRTLSVLRVQPNMRAMTVQLATAAAPPLRITIVSSLYITTLVVLHTRALVVGREQIGLTIVRNH